MKSTKPKIGLLVASALVGLSQGASASNPSINRFYPLEVLTPKVRVQFESKLREIEKIEPINWDVFLAGVNDQGDLVIINRIDFDLVAVVQPSCW